VVDTPLLAETTNPDWGMAGVIVVDAPVEVAVERLVRHRGLSEADARARIAVQASREERRRIADIVIDNSGEPSQLEREVARAWEWALGLRDR
jgi:dephospho-CoA kinase